MSNISATRRGFLYQDRVAIVLYLQEFISKNVKKFYIDFPSKGKKSLDIKHLDKNENEIIYEIKSGEEFKKDKKNKESSVVRDAFLNLKEYSDDFPEKNCKLILIIRKGFQNNISEYWTRICNIKRQSFSMATNDLFWLLNKLRLPRIKTEEDLYDFCKLIECVDYPDDIIKEGCDRFSDIDDMILSQIDDLALRFRADSCVYEYPSCILKDALFRVCSIQAGTSRDIHPIFLKEIKKFLTNRRFLDEHYKKSSGLNNKKKEIEAKIEDEVNAYFELTPEPLIPPITLGSEGKQYE